jgi:hypothetical protein
MLWTVAHTYNPTYMGGRDCEDHSLKVAWAKKCGRPHLNQWLGT